MKCFIYPNMNCEPSKNPISLCYKCLSPFSIKTDATEMGFNTCRTVGLHAVKGAPSSAVSQQGGNSQDKQSVFKQNYDIPKEAKP